MNSPPTNGYLPSLVPRDTGLPPYQTNEDVGRATQSHIRPYTVVGKQVKHVYHLVNKKGKPWATLKFPSVSRSPENVPIIVEGSDITGTFELDVDSDHILDITIIVCCLLIHMSCA
jgi:hypothetical protein